MQINLIDNNVPSLINTAVQKHQLGKLDEAESIYRQILQIQPNCAEREVSSENRYNLIAITNLGIILQQQGQLEAAIESYQQALSLKPDWVQAHYNLGNVLQQQGQLEAAIESYQQAINLKPDAGVYNNLGNALRRQGQLEAAVESYQQAINLKPELAEAHYNLGITLQQQGQLETAVNSYQQAIRLKHNWTQAHYNLGNALRHKGQLEAAVKSYQQAIRLKPDWAQAHYNLGITLQQQGQLETAVESYRQALNFKPDAGIYNNLGNALQQQGRLEAAVESYQQAINLKPELAEAHYNLGITLQQQGQLETAVESYRQAIRLKPDAEVYNNLGNALQQQGQLEAALESYQQAINLKPDAGVYNNLGNALQEQGQLEAALESYQQAIGLQPDLAEAYQNSGNALREQGQLEAALESYQQAINLKPDSTQAKFSICVGQLPIIYSSFEEIHLRRYQYQQHLQKLAQSYQLANQKEREKAAEAVGSSQPFYLAYQGLNDRDLQQTYGAMICQLMSSRYPQWSQPIPMPRKDAHEKIRVGFVSGFFRAHSNWKIPIKGWIENLDRNKFELFGYHTGSRRDLSTARAAQAFVQFIQGPLPVEKWCEVITQDNLDVLIFPEFGMDPTTVQLGCLRLAPIQMTSWGHPQTSGLPTIDYYLSSELMEPENAQENYTERLVRLPNLSIYYTPLEIQAKAISKKEIGLTNNEIMFWCCQSLFKYLPQHDDVFPRIAQELTNCKFVFINHHLSEQVTEVFRQRLSRAFEEKKLNYQDYCIFLPRLDNSTFAGTAAMADVFLDSIAWSGCNSTMEAINYDIPIVTWPGDLMRGRHTLAMLKMMGVEETIASSKDEYVKMAIRLGQDSQYRQHISRQVTENKYKLYEDLKPIKALEEFLLNAVQSSLDLPKIPASQPHQILLTKDWLREQVPQSVLSAVERTPGWLSLEEAALLYHLARQTTTGSIIEVGSYRGRSTVALSKGALAGGNRPIYAVEPHEEFEGTLGGQFGPEDRGAFYQTMLNTSSYQNVRLVNLSSEVIAPGWKESVSLLWIDGDHTYEGVRRDFECWRDHLAPAAYIAFDDAVDPRLGPHKLVGEITQSGEFNPFVTIGKVVVVVSSQKMKKLTQELHTKSLASRGYYTLINHPHKFIFFWNAKCGCSTLKKIFYEITEGDFYSGDNIHGFIGYLNSHKYFVPKENLENYSHYKKIIVVRDPWSRLVSFYTNKTLLVKKESNIDIQGIFDSKNYSFNELVHIMFTIKPELFQHHLELQSSGLEDIEFDHVIRLSEMSQKLPSILQSLGIDVCRLRSLSANSNSTAYDLSFMEKVMHLKPQEFDNFNRLPSFHCFYDEKLINMVAKIYERDILKFNLSYPKKERRVGRPTLSEALKLAVEHHRAHRLAQAEEVYHQILEQQPQHPEALYGLGVLAQQMDQYQRAQQFLTALLGVQPESVKGWFSLGNLRQVQGQLSEAVEAYQQALAIQPDAVAVHNNLGYTLQLQGKWEEAITCYQQALKLQPDCPEAEVNWGNALYAQGKLSPEKQAHYAGLNYDLGVARQKAGDLKTAVAYYRQAIAMKPDLVDAHVQLGSALADVPT